MNYDFEINRLIEIIKTDKTLTQPWRNYAVKYGCEMQMAISMAKRMTHLEAPQQAQNSEMYQLTTQPPNASENPLEIAQDSNLNGTYNCICPAGAKDSTCKVHGK